MINRIERELRWEKRKPITPSLHIHGWNEHNNSDNPLSFYGSDLSSIQEKIQLDESGWINNTLKIHKAQIEWAVKNEMARTLEDVLARRTRALLLDAAASVRIAPAVAEIMAKCLGEDERWVDQQVSEYTSLAKNYIL